MVSKKLSRSCLSMAAAMLLSAGITSVNATSGTSSADRLVLNAVQNDVLSSDSEDINVVSKALSEQLMDNFSAFFQNFGGDDEEFARTLGKQLDNSVTVTKIYTDRLGSLQNKVKELLKGQTVLYVSDDGFQGKIVEVAKEVFNDDFASKPGALSSQTLEILKKAGVYKDLEDAGKQAYTDYLIEQLETELAAKKTSTTPAKAADFLAGDVASKITAGDVRSVVRNVPEAQRAGVNDLINDAGLVAGSTDFNTRLADLEVKLATILQGGKTEPEVVAAAKAKANVIATGINTKAGTFSAKMQAMKDKKIIKKDLDIDQANYGNMSALRKKQAELDVELKEARERLETAKAELDRRLSTDAKTKMAAALTNLQPKVKAFGLNESLATTLTPEGVDGAVETQRNALVEKIDTLVGKETEVDSILGKLKVAANDMSADDNDKAVEKIVIEIVAKAKTGAFNELSELFRVNVDGKEVSMKKNMFKTKFERAVKGSLDDLIKAIVDDSTAIKAFNEKVAELKKACGDYQSYIDTAKEKDLQDKVAVAQAEVENIQKSLDKVAGKYGTALVGVSGKGTPMAEQGAKLTELQGKVDSLTAEKENAVNDLTDQLNEKGNAINNLRDQLNELQKNFDALTTQFNEKEAEFDKVQQELKDLKDAKAKEIEELNEEITTSAKVKIEVDNRVKVLENQIAGLKTAKENEIQTLKALFAKKVQAAEEQSVEYLDEKDALEELLKEYIPSTNLKDLTAVGKALDALKTSATAAATPAAPTGAEVKDEDDEEEVAMAFFKKSTL